MKEATPSFIHNYITTFFIMQQQTIFNRNLRKRLLMGLFSVVFLLFIGVSSAMAQSYVSPAEALQRIEPKILQLKKDFNVAQSGSNAQFEVQRKITLYKMIGVYVQQTSNVGESITLGMRHAFAQSFSSSPATAPTKVEMQTTEAEAIALLSN